MRKKLITLVSAVAVLLLSFLGYLGFLQLSGNFHEVLAGELYRSNQPSAEQLALYVKQHSIKTVINLRGENDGSTWYKDEVSESKALGVHHVDFAMSARETLSMDKAEALVEIMRTSPKPILIHCRSGSDRTGLASAIYLGKIAGVDPETAEKQLSIRYGHLSVPLVSAAYPMDESWERIETSLARM